MDQTNFIMYMYNDRSCCYSNGGLCKGILIDINYLNNIFDNMNSEK